MFPIIKRYEDLINFNADLRNRSNLTLNIISVSYSRSIVNYSIGADNTPIEAGIDRFLYEFVTSEKPPHLLGGLYRFKKYDFTKLICLTHPDIFMKEYLEPFLNNLIMMGETDFKLWDYDISLIGTDEIRLADAYNEKAEELFIPYFIASMSIKVFTRHKNLKKVHIQEGSKLKKIENLAFSYCKKLTEINLPEGLETIGSGAFEWSGLKEIVIPSSVTLIKDLAFKNCGHLENVIIKKDSKLEVIGADAFMQSRISSIALPNNLMQIGDAAFATCTRLNEVCLPDSVTEVGENAFSHCSSLRSIILGKGIKVIPKNFVNTCYALTSVVIKGNIEGVEKDAFRGVPIEEIEIPEDSPMIFNSDIGNSARYGVKFYTN